MAWRRPEVVIEDPRATNIERGLTTQINEFHCMDFRDIKEIEIELLEQQLSMLKAQKVWNDIPKGTIVFTPSGASKCPRELYYKFKKETKDKQAGFPYQKRWTRNSTAVHGAVQKDFLYMEKLLENPAFTIAKNDKGFPMWEENVKTIKLFEHDDVMFALSGMMDGVLDYNPDGSQIGFEFKTKSNTMAQVGDYKMKGIAEYHKTQAIAYHHMFDLDEFVFMYEAVVKDYWHKGAEAKIDFRTFHYRPTDEEKTSLLNKFSTIVKSVKDGALPDGDPDKCMFCEFKDICKEEKQ